MYNNALECIKLVGIVWKVGTLKTLKINKFCKMTLFTAQNNTFNHEVNMSYITFLLLFFKSFYFSKQLHSAKVFNNQQFNYSYFIHNTCHFYTFFTFIIHKIHSLRVECVNFVKSCPKMSNQNSQKKNFSGLHHPLSELAPRLPPPPFKGKSTAIYQYVTTQKRPT